MAKNINVNNKTHSVDINTNAKQMFLKINGRLIHINTFYDGKIIITTYNIPEVVTKASEEVKIISEKY